MNYPKNRFLACDTIKCFRSLPTFGLMLWFFQSLLCLAMNVCTHWLQKELNFSQAAAALCGPALVLNTTQLMCFRPRGCPGSERGHPCPIFPVWKTSKGWVSGSWRKYSPVILSTTQDAVKSGNLWKKWADYTERTRRTTRHVGLYFLFSLSYDYCVPGFQFLVWFCQWKNLVSELGLLCWNTWEMGFNNARCP